MDILSVTSVNELLASLNWRYAVKQFDPTRKIPDDHWSALETALVLTPSSYGLQPWKFVVVTDAQVRQRLLPMSMGQRQVVDCSHLVVFAARSDITTTDIDRWLARLVEIRGIPESTAETLHTTIIGDLVTGPRHKIAAEWAKRQVYLALGVFLSSAAAVGIDTCPMEGFDPTGYDNILDLPARGYTTAVVATAGYRSASDHMAHAPKARFARADVILPV